MVVHHNAKVILQPVHA